MLTDEQVAEIVETTYPCEWETDYDPCNPTCALCLKRSTCALLTDRAELVAEMERLRDVARAAQAVDRLLGWPNNPDPGFAEAKALGGLRKALAAL